MQFFFHMIKISVILLLYVVACFSFVEAASAELPAEQIDLSPWKLTLPFDDDGNDKPDEIKQPELADFKDPRCFFVDPETNGIIFRAHAGGSTTPNSKYPRCELREMTPDGKARAAWATDDAVTHTMTLRVQINRLPKAKPHVVCAQIHGGDDDLMMIRLERKKLFIERNKIGDIALDNNYQLGTPFDIKIQASGGSVKVWHNGKQKMDWPVAAKDCYFKAGCYTQTNVKRGDQPDVLGELLIHQLEVRHIKPPPKQAGLK